MMLNDHLQRQQATDPRGSFIVQAPAGSGKTEILTQRYLRLLSGVTSPEQIIALTFTRKAANEMRERIVLALQQAEKNTQASSAHQQQTLTFAKEALARDKALNWQLIQQPSRLRIITIDSLCQTLTQAIPLQEKQIPYAQISDKPQSHYKTAARACFQFLLEQEAYQPALKTLLAHVDNRQDQLLDLFQELLSKRDQWLHHLYQAKEQNKDTYEHALAWIIEHELTRFKQTIPQSIANELMLLARNVTSIENNPQSPRFALRDWESLDVLDDRLAASLAALILTTQNTLRKAFDHHIGFKKELCSDKEYKELKAASKILLGTLEELPDFLPALLRVKKLPSPHYDQQQWEVLQALFTLLPVLAAHLQLVFGEHNEVDFSEISAQALMALGTDEEPTDLALYLDNTIHHLLVDEFQDTSIQQFQLLSKLVESWQPDDGNTLFVVGDPMQSIYRFRAAEVGLFLRAKQDGIGPVRFTPLELTCNFRSTDTIVNWVNHQFQSIFPALDDMESGAIRFHASVPVKATDEHSQVLAFQFRDKRQEALSLVHLISSELENHPDDDIAILVRSRRQLTDIIQELRQKNIPFQGVDIDLLSRLPHLRDIWSLTQALLMPANRLAWLSFLRSPWCGLSLADLHSLANLDKYQSIYIALSKLENIAELSHEGRARAQFIYTVMHEALILRYQKPLVTWLTDTLSQLHLLKILNTTEQNDLEQYWQLLERFEQHGQLNDLEQFSQAFNKLYSQQVVPSRLQIMTIHKSKGLEFDCVIIPGLSTKTPRIDTPMLRWLQLPSQENDQLWLLSPIKAAHEDDCVLYDYLAKLDTEKNHYETQRLLYVAVTRAKKRLYLTDHSETQSTGSFRDLLSRQEFGDAESEDAQNNSATTYPPLYRLPLTYYQQAPKLLPRVSNPPPVIATNNTPRLIGIVAHELLQWMCDHHPTNEADIPWALAKHQLISLGFHGNELTQAEHKIHELVTGFFNNPTGQWIMQAHDQEKNEYELLVDDQHNIVTKIIDRTFVENGIRWIIDFKTGKHDEQSNKKHQEQVNHYARIFENRDKEQSISCGLYYLDDQHFEVWTREDKCLQLSHE